ncbi:MAG: ribose-5-phosphate isomerase RpiA [Chloroflexaceae bacterium]|nr:ribose-5-phosphate isomerase RpiA [Chloroflexaceae bacterium]
MNLKQLVAEHAVQQVRSGMRLGLGTGSTVRYVLESLAERLRQGSLQDLAGIPTSEATAQQARTLGIPLTTFEACPWLAMTIDGADEVDPDLNLIKGLGGALLREKVVAAASDQLVIVVDESKRVERLGTRSPLPVEVLPLGWNTNLPRFERLGAVPAVRCGADGQPYVTDNGNLIVDCTFPEGIHDPAGLARELDACPGVMGHGLFLGMATVVFVGTSAGVVQLLR